MAYLGKTPSQAVRSRYYYTATGGETSLSGSDDNSNVLTFTDGNYVDVSLNGVALVAGTDYNTTTTNTIGGLTALVASDVVEVIVYDTFSVFSGNVTGDFTVGGTLTAANITNTGNLNFGDNDKAIFGAGSDLQIYHNGSASAIQDTGSGDLFLAGDNNVLITNSDFSENKAKFISNAGVALYYDNNQKFITTSTGVDVTGTVTADRLDIDYGVANSAAALIDHTDTANGNGVLITAGGSNSGKYVLWGRDGSGNSRFYASSNGDISFYEDTGTNAKFFWDASAESLGIGTSSPSSFFSGARQLVVGSGSSDQGVTIYSGTAGNAQIFFADGTSGADAYRGIVRYIHSDNAMTFYTDGANERMRIDSSGNVGINTSSLASGPVSPLTVNKGNVTGAGQWASSAIAIANPTNIGAYSQISFGYTTVSNASAYIGYVSTNQGANGYGDLVFGTRSVNTNTQPSERMRIDSSGNVRVFNDLAVDGDLRIKGTEPDDVGRLLISVNDTQVNFQGNESSAQTDKEFIFAGGNQGIDRIATLRNGGINFGSDTANANLLDDYEEGSWTPATGGGTAAAGSAAIYIKIGRSVTVMADVTFTGVTSPTYAITGLPFQSNGVQPGACIAWNNNSRYLSLLAPPTTSVLHMYDQQASLQNINNNNRFIFTVTYQT